MSPFDRATATDRTLTRRALWVLCCAMSLSVACGEAEPSGPTFVLGGSGGTGGTAGSGGVVGSGGSGGSAGTGASAGSGSGGDGGMSGTGGSGAVGGGSGGTSGGCATSALCHTCPDRLLCDTDNDCAFSGYVCVASGCDTLEGAAIKQCQPSRGGSCVDEGECPNTSDYDCINVGAGGKRCVRVTPGCDPANETYDCVPGFSCEGGACVDRRVPCDNYLDCPKNHVCSVTPTASFCVRVFRTCHRDEDCAGFGTFCADIDNDGEKECAGELGSSGEPCVNAVDCGGSAPVCEAGASGTNASCGDFGLCTGDQCDSGFECVALWQDGRSECVPVGGSCDQVSDCPLQQVCAASRSGNPPSCQAGTAP